MNKYLPPLLAASCLFPAPAAQTLEHTYRTAGPAVHDAFEPVREHLQESSAVFSRRRDEIIFGTVVSPDGHILTKASELGDLDGVSVLVNRETYENPELVAEDPSWDVALVKIDARGLTPVDLSHPDEPEQGAWVVANGATTRLARRVQVGVIAAKSRPVYARGGTVLGVSLSSDEDGDELRIDGVTEETGAARAGLEAGDRIVTLDGEKLASREEIVESLERREVGDFVTLGVMRDGEALELEVELSARADVFGEQRTRNDAMSGEYSERRTGFPRVIQHDIQANRHFIGGPVFDLDGRCVGMNIARFSRCETYAIPARELADLARRLMAGADGR